MIHLQNSQRYGLTPNKGYKNNFRQCSIVVYTCTCGGTCVYDPLYLDAGVVQLLGKGVHGLQQVLACLWVNVGSPCGDLN